MMRDHAFKDSDLLGIGYVVVFIFVVVVLSSTDNFLEDSFKTNPIHSGIERLQSIEVKTLACEEVKQSLMMT